ncbi:hypothetical protein GUJ93_ZPchr0007g4774 [Zizania palustris]|uniref:Uncharacterized protein n=1 Tax=Zizania palustris TaxID=103762 RepID=A0A8J5T708_ZIZPA|nr:hypothetical protein GUJ93_ZPchr0007g4774 [Zizania palustris]
MGTDREAGGGDSRACVGRPAAGTRGPTEWCVQSCLCSPLRVSVPCFFVPPYASTRADRHGVRLQQRAAGAGVQEHDGRGVPGALLYGKGLDSRSALEHFRLNPPISTPSTATDSASIP